MRRSPLVTAVATLACLVPASAQSFPYGTMVAAPAPDTAIVWAAADTDGELLVRYGPGAEPDRHSDPVPLRAADGRMAKVTLRSLQPATRYRYKVELRLPDGRTVPGPLASFQTPPLPVADTAVTIAFGADVHALEQFDQWTRLLAQAPDLYLSLGDMPYADAAKTRDEFRALHLRLRVDARWQAFFGATALAPMWDDHEIGNDWDAETDQGRVADGIAAFRECLPVADGPLYRSLRWGSGVELFLLDCRSQRVVNEAPDLPGKSMLGAVQFRWLIDAVAASTATFKVIATSVPLRGGTTVKDSWLGFQRERDALFVELRARRVDGVVFVTGDQHWPAVHRHPEGFLEVQTGPLATSLREPPRFPGDEVGYVGRGINFGLLRYDPAQQPPTLRLSLHGPDGELHSTEVVVAERAAVRIDGAVAGVRLAGPEPVRGSGRVVRRADLLPGDYTAHFAATDGSQPVSLPFQLPAGAVAGIAVAPPMRDELLALDFDTMPALRIADEGMVAAPSAWFTSGGVLWQSSAIRGAPDDQRRAGTTATVAGEVGDALVAVRMWSAHDGQLGLWVRRRGDDGLRYCQHRAGRRRWLEQWRGGVCTVLAEQPIAYERHRWYALEVEAVGETATLRIDGVPVATVAAPGLPRIGAVAVWTNGNELAAFDDLVIRKAPAPRAVVFASAFADPARAEFEDQHSNAETPFWRVDHGVLRAGTSAAAPFVATASIARAEVDADARVRVLVRPLRRGGPFGVVARWTGPEQHYRFVWDPAKDELRLERQLGSFVEVLGRQPAPVDDGRWHELALQVVGFRLRATCDDAIVAQALDGACSTGRSGLWADATAGAEFASFAVTAPLQPRSVLGVLATAAGVAGSAAVVGRSPTAVGALGTVMLQLDRPFPALAVTSGGFEPFVLQRAAAPLLGFLGQRVGLGAALLFEPGSGGELEAELRWPRLPALCGQAVLVTVWLSAADGSALLERLPPVALVL